MNIFELDCNYFCDIPTTHKYISDTLNFPEYYGNNLDALYDILSTMYHSDTTIIFKNFSSITENLSDYGNILLNVFKDASDFNDNLVIKFLK